MQVIILAVWAFTLVAVAYLWIFLLSHLLLVMASLRVVLRRTEIDASAEAASVAGSSRTPSVSIVVAAFNESAVIVDSVRSLLEVDHPDYEIIVVDDGSTDDTVARLREAFVFVELDNPPPPSLPCAPIRQVLIGREHPHLLLLTKDNGGRGDALNAAIGMANSELVCLVDADSLLERDALLHGVRPFRDDPEHVVAVGGMIRVANGSRFDRGQVQSIGLDRSALGGLQTLEYLRSFLAGRVAWASLNGLLIISGAFGIFRREILIDLGGLATDTIGEDMELTMRLHDQLRRDNPEARIVFEPDAVCWTEAPGSLRDLAGQRIRWHVGLLENLWRHRRMLGRRGAAGKLAFPYMLLFEVAGPFLEALGVVALASGIALDIFEVSAVGLTVLCAILIGSLLSLAGVLTEELGFARYPRLGELLRLAGWSLVETLWYRQLNTLWRLIATYRWLRRKEALWGTIERGTAFGQDPADTPEDQTLSRSVRAR